MSEKYPVEELLTHSRVQLFSSLKTDAMELAHEQLNGMVKKYSDIAFYSAILVIEKDSKWISAQIGPFHSKADADQYAEKLDTIFPKDQPCPVTANIVHQEGKELEKGEVHNWL